MLHLISFCEILLDVQEASGRVYYCMN